MKTELKPCPFCGGKALMFRQNVSHRFIIGKHYEFQVVCENVFKCKIQPKTRWAMVGATAKRRWNKRSD